MIQDQSVRSDILQEWGAVKKMCSDGVVRLIPGAGYVQETPPDGFYNLPFLLAYAVLDQTLSEMIDEGTIQCTKKRPMLGDKMAASATAIQWQQYDLVEAGRIARNDLAHEAILLSKSECFKYIKALETELNAWGVL